MLEFWSVEVTLMCIKQTTIYKHCLQIYLQHTHTHTHIQQFKYKQKKMAYAKHAIVLQNSTAV